MNPATMHARKRMQQRSITAMQVRLVQAFGCYQYQKGGASIAYIPAREIAELRRAIDKIENVAVVVSEDGDKVLTVMHKTRRIKTTEYAA